MNFSKDTLPKLISATLSNKTALLVAGLTLTTFASAYHSDGHVASNQNQHATASTKMVTYTAHGTTDRKTTKIFKQLMQNNPNIQVTAKVIQKTKPIRNKSMSVAVNYTIKGKTDKATARKLIQLFKTSKHIEITANINQKPASFKQNAYSRSTPYYYNGYQAYYIPPVTNPKIWYRVPTWTQPYAQDKKLNISQAPFPMDYSLNLAKK